MRAPQDELDKSIGCVRFVRRFKLGGGEFATAQVRIPESIVVSRDVADWIDVELKRLEKKARRNRVFFSQPRRSINDWIFEHA